MTCYPQNLEQCQLSGEYSMIVSNIIICPRVPKFCFVPIFDHSLNATLPWYQLYFHLAMVSTSCRRELSAFVVVVSRDHVGQTSVLAVVTFVRTRAPSSAWLLLMADTPGYPWIGVSIALFGSGCATSHQFDYFSINFKSPHSRYQYGQ